MLQSLKLLLPALIPSWRFFDEIAPSPRIEFTLPDTPGHWQEFRPRPAHLSIKSMLARLFWNPYWNESLFLVSCSERLLETPTEHSQQEILKRIKAQFADAPHVQFRLVLLNRHGTELQKNIAYISPVYSL